MKRIKKYIRSIISKFGYDKQKIEAYRDLAQYYDIFGKDSVGRRAFYNIGAGSFFHPAWTNVDYDSEWYKINRKNLYQQHNIQYDLFSLNPLPIESNSAELVYSSHTIEHVTDETDTNLFREVYRILKKDGVFRVTTNNIDLTYRAYRQNDRLFFYWSNWRVRKKDYEEINLVLPMTSASIQQLFLYDFASQLCTMVKDGAGARIDDAQLDRIFDTMPYQDALNYCISKCSVEIQKLHPGFHINWFNPDKTIQMLKNAGFRIVDQSGYGQSRSPVLRNTNLFDSTHPKISLYVEAIK